MDQGSANVSPCRPSLYPPRDVSLHPLRANQLNFCASCANSFSSIICTLFNSLAALFRARFLCFQQFAHSFAKMPGVGVGIPIRSSDSQRETKTRRRRYNYGTPGAGHFSTSAPRFASAVTCTTWRLYPLWPQSIAHTSCHHGGVSQTQLLRSRRTRLASPTPIETGGEAKSPAKVRGRYRTGWAARRSYKEI